jgi:2-keto-3-deoxy-L-rhamnonate aldolase RhmA
VPTSVPFENPVKRKLRAGQRTAGAWLQIASPITAEILSRAGFDWLIVDMEHGPGDILTLTAQLQAMSSGGATPLVRATSNEAALLKRILDAGAAGVVVPHVNSRAEAEAAVRACRYPPAGIRGIAGSPRAAGYGQNSMDYLTRANDEILVFVAVETTEAVANVDATLGVPGLDGIFIGPMDLATSMGHFGNVGHPDVQTAIAAVEARVRPTGKALMTVASTWEQANALYERGYQLLTLMHDGLALARVGGELIRQFRAAYPQG